MAAKKQAKKQVKRKAKKTTKSGDSVEKHLSDLQKDLDAHTKGTKSAGKGTKEPVIHKQRLLWVLMVIIPAIVIVFLAILLVQSERMLDMKAEMLGMGEEIGELREQNAFYKRAYELTLEDVRVLAEAFGGDERYELLSEELRRTEIETVLGVTDGTIYALSNERLWREYVEKGLVNQTCLPVVEADTIARTTMLSISTAGKGRFGVYVDGNFLQDVTVTEATTSRVSVELREGGHEITFFLKEGSVTLTGLLFDLVEIPVEMGVLDTGVANKGYDCEDIEPLDTRATLSDEGNVRFFVQKK